MKDKNGLTLSVGDCVAFEACGIVQGIAENVGCAQVVTESIVRLFSGDVEALPNAVPPAEGAKVEGCPQ